MNPGLFVEFGMATPVALNTLLVAPLFGGVLGYVLALLAIAVYNVVAKKYPISFKLSKK
jgi:hypothetical protein